MARVNLNDLELETYVREVHRWHEHLDRQMRDRMDGALFLTLMQIEEAAKKAQERLNRMRWPEQFARTQE